MIIQTGMRTDIPAFYSKWLLNRLDEGFVIVRNPYNPSQLFQYALNPEVVDVLAFCTKNPIPLLSSLEKLGKYRQYWHVTITPYGKDVEPNVPNKVEVLNAFKSLSKTIGKDIVAWRYDPIFIDDRYSIDFHISAFSRMASTLKGYTNIAIISFIDLYNKTKKNFHEAKEVSNQERRIIGKVFSEIARKNNMVLKTCAEGDDLEVFGIDCSGCMTTKAIEKALGITLALPNGMYKRKGCACCLFSDIGTYNTCPHLCRYCYANNDINQVQRNFKSHNPDSPILIGDINSNDIILKPKQYSYISNQGFLEL